MDVMRDIFSGSGQVAPISPLGAAGSLPPIIHAPAKLDPALPKLVLCYFLVKTAAELLDDILAANPMPGVEVRHRRPRTPLSPCRVSGTHN